MDKLEKIPVEVHIKSRGFVPARNLVLIVDLIERAVLETEIIELDILQSEFKEFSAITYDAVRLRLYHKSGYSFQINNAANGSLILGGIAAGLCIWLLNQTLGETVKEVWLESNAHHNLKNFLKKRIGPKPRRIGASIQKRLEANGLEAGIKVSKEKVSVSINSNQDKDMASELESKHP